MALELNAAEQGAPESGYFLGSWCHDDQGLTFVSFLPNVLHKPGMVQNFVMSSVNRVRWVTEEYFGFDIEQPCQQATEQKLARMAAFAEFMNSALEERGAIAGNRLTQPLELVCIMLLQGNVANRQ
jgi:hypothetical protein